MEKREAEASGARKKETTTQAGIFIMAPAMRVLCGGAPLTRWLRSRVESLSREKDDGLERDHARFEALWKGRQQKNEEDIRPAEFYKILTRVWWKHILARTILGITRQAAVCSLPFIIRELIASKRESRYYFATALVCVQCVTMAFHRIETSLGTSLTGKCESVLRIVGFSAIMNQRNKSTTHGTLEAIFFNDIGEIAGFLNVLHQVITLSVSLVALIALLFPLMGWSALAAIGSTAVIIFLSSVIARIIFRSHAKMCGIRDLRLDMFKHSFDCFKNIKCHQLEQVVQKELVNIHLQEQGQLCRVSVWSTLQASLVTAILPLSVFTSFMVFSGTGHTFTPSLIYAVISLFALLQTPLLALPTSLMQLSKLLVAAGRVLKLLGIGEESSIQSNWTKEKSYDKRGGPSPAMDPPIWDNMRPGTITGITGRSGSGKTALLRKILNREEKVCFVWSEKNISKTSSMKAVFVPEKPFLFYATIRENILFGNTFNEQRYQQVLRACSLVSDLKALSEGDRTLASEYSLSDGTRCRINIARAAYSKSQVVLLDNIFSSLDPVVAQHIFRYCLRGILRKKVIFLVSSDKDVLSQVDQIIEMGPDGDQQVSTARQTATDSVSQDNDSKFQVGDGISLSARLRCVQTLNQTYRESNLVPEREPLQKHRKFGTRLAKMNVSGNSNKKEISTFVRYSGGYVCWLVLFLVIFVASSVQVFSLWWLGWGFSSGYNTEPVNSNYAVVLAIYLGQTSTFLLLIALSSLFIGYMLRRLSKILYEKMIEFILKASMCWYSVQSTAEVLSIHNQDFGILDEKLSVVLLLLLCVASYVISLVAMVSVFVPVALAIFFSALIVILLLWKWQSMIAGSLAAQKADLLQGVSSITILHEGINGTEVIRSFKQVSWFLQRMLTAVQQESVFTSFQNTIDTVAGIAIDLISLVTLISLVFLVTMKEESESERGMPLISVLLLVLLVKLFLGILSTAKSNFESINKILKFSASAYQRPESKNTTSSERFPKSWPAAGSIKMQNVCVDFLTRGKLALSAVSINVDGGEFCAVIGRTGSGKSTLLTAIGGLLDDDRVCQGLIEIDSCNLLDIPTESLRSKVILLPSSPFIHESKSIRYNIDPKDEYEDYELNNILRIVDLGSLQRLSGKSLSLGEQHLLCLARALLKKPKVLLCDELTSAVDRKMKLRLTKLFHKLADDYDITILVTTHDMNVATNADRIIFMQDGFAADVSKVFTTKHLS